MAIERGGKTAVRLWYREFAAGTLKPSSKANYHNCIQKHLIPRFGHLPLNGLTTVFAQTNFTDMVTGNIIEEREPLAASTVVKCRNIINAAMRQAMEMGMIQANPIERTKPPRIENTSIEMFSAEEQDKFVNALVGNRLEAFFLTALGTGFRRGELLGLEWDCIDFNNKLITVKSTVNRIQDIKNGGTNIIISSPKSVASRRTIPLVDTLIPVLKQHKKVQDTEKVFAGSAWMDNNIVFSTSIGTYLEPRNINREMKKICAKANINPISVHGLRHSFASRLIEQGVHIKFVAEYLGHNDGGSLALQTYGHIDVVKSHDEINKINTLVIPKEDTTPSFHRSRQAAIKHKRKQKVEKDKTL
ncbi:site-specific integrase [Oscillospiraceae bacterium OttesenSCG-928-F05]|nr:site-specific integrase [Oscillospiraceae bacterium OttesenSCG-928-F05]